MQAKRILIPLDLVHSTIEPLLFVQGMAAEVPICVTLLHVISVDLTRSERSVYDELCAEAQAGLCKLAGLFFGEDAETRTSVCTGRPHEQIVLEARRRHSDLIILTAGKSRSWARVFRTNTAQRVVRGAPCATLVLPRLRPAAQFVRSLEPVEDTENTHWPEARTQGREAAGKCFGETSNRIYTPNDNAGVIQSNQINGFHGTS